MVDTYEWPTLGSEGDTKSIKKESSNVAVTNKQKDKVEVANIKPQPIVEDIRASPEVFEKPVEVEEVPKTPVVESIEKVSNASTATVVTTLNVNRSNPNDDKVKYQPKTNNLDGGRKEYNSTKSRWNRYEDEKPSSMPLPPTPQQPSRNRQERDDRHAISNRTYGQSNSNRYTRSSQPPASLPHTTAATNGKPISNNRNGYNKRNDDVPSNTNYSRANRNAKQLIGRPVLINTAVTASIPYGPFYYYSNPIIDTVASIKESIKRQM